MDTQAIYDQLTETLQVSEALLAILVDEFDALRSEDLLSLQTLETEKQQLLSSLSSHQAALLEMTDSTNNPEQFKAMIRPFKHIELLVDQLNTNLANGQQQNQKNGLLLQKASIRNKVLLTLLRGQPNSTYNASGSSNQNQGGQLIGKI